MTPRRTPHRNSSSRNASFQSSVTKPSLTQRSLGSVSAGGALLLVRVITCSYTYTPDAQLVRGQALCPCHPVPEYGTHSQRVRHPAGQGREWESCAAARRVRWRSHQVCPLTTSFLHERVLTPACHALRRPCDFEVDVTPRSAEKVALARQMAMATE